MWALNSASRLLLTLHSYVQIVKYTRWIRRPSGMTTEAVPRATRETIFELRCVPCGRKGGECYLDEATCCSEEVYMNIFIRQVQLILFKAPGNDGSSVSFPSDYQTMVSYRLRKRANHQ